VISQNDERLKSLIDNGTSKLCGPTCLTNMSAAIRKTLDVPSPYATPADEVQAIVDSLKSNYNNWDAVHMGMNPGHLRILESHLADTMPADVKLQIKDAMLKKDLLVSDYRMAPNQAAILEVGGWSADLTERETANFHYVILVYDSKQRQFFLRDPKNS